MKKLFVAILAVLYMGVSTGATLHLHYCMGRLIGWDLGHQDGHTCGNCGMKKDASFKGKGCCKDEHKQIKLANDQKIVESSIQLMHVSGAFPLTVYGVLPDAKPVAVAQAYPLSHSPPGSSTPIFILHRVFRI